jgi:putative transposase
MRLQETSATTGRPYPVRLVLDVAGLSSACWYTGPRVKAEKARPGPKPIISDEELLTAIRADLQETHFHGEGHKKVRARLRRKGIRAGRKRYLRLMKAHGLLAPVRVRGNGSARAHDGTIRCERPNQMWGTDGKQFWTRQDGLCWFFSVIDHCHEEILSWHVTKVGNRFAALEPVREAIRREFGVLRKGIAENMGLSLRNDHGSQYDSRDFQNEVKYLGLIASPAFVRSPECNGIIERFHRTLQEQVFDIHSFENLDEARSRIATFIDDYNRFWLLERHGHRSPLEIKESFLLTLQKCA